MALAQIINEEAQKLVVRCSDDVIPTFILAFSNLGTIDEYLGSALNRVSIGLPEPQANEAKIRYIVSDILKLANNGARDAKFDFVDAYMIWLVIVMDQSLIQYLKTDFIKIPPGYPQKIGSEILGPNKIEYPAFSGVIGGYLQLIPLPNKGQINPRPEIRELLYDHFKQSDIIVLNLENVYNELLRFTSEKILSF